MKPATWRAAVLGLCAAAAFLAVVAVVDQWGAGGAPPWYGLWGALFVRSSDTYNLEVGAIDPGGPAESAGLRDGDLIDVRPNTLVERFSLLGQPLNGRPITLSVRRGSRIEQVVLLPRAPAFSRWWSYLVLEFGAFWLSLFAALIAWRRPFVGGNLLLSTALALAAIGIGAPPGFLASPWAWMYILIGICGVAYPLSVAAWATFVSGFAKPLTKTRQMTLWLCYALVAAFIVIGDGTADLPMGLVTIVGMATLWFNPLIFYGPAWTIVGDAATISACVCSGLAIVAATGVERQRAAWSVVPLIGLYVTGQFYGPATSWLPYSTIVLVVCANAIFNIITPVVLTYVALSRRLIDVGFALNRTVVFAFVSTIVIGAFVLVEWAASEWFAGTNHNASAVIGMVVALALGLSLRYIHRYVDRFVDHVFFRKRHENEAALRRFAHEASYISDRATLIERAVVEVRRNTGAENASILLRIGPAGYAAMEENGHALISENDPGILALHAWGIPVDLTRLQDSALRGELAFPMISRGDLVGVLVCGPKIDGESYAPDESDALFALAQGVGSALGVLSAEADQSSRQILRELAALREDARRILGLLPRQPS